MISHPIRARFGLQGIDEIDDGEGAEEGQEQPAPARRKRRKRISSGTMSSRAQCVEDDRSAENKEERLPGKLNGAEHKNDRAEQCPANQQREQALFPSIKTQRQLAEQERAQRPRGGDGEQPAEQNGQNGQRRVHYRRNPMRVRMKPNV